MSSSWPEQSKSTRIPFWLLGIVAAIAAGLIIILTSGGGDGGPDSSGDLSLVEGEQPRRATALPVAASMADVVEADVRRDGSDLVFEVTTASSIPQELERSSLELRFDVSEDGRDTWIVSATVNVAVTAAVVSQVTDYGSSTIDGTLPGSVEVSGETLVIRLQPQDIEGFPETFDWTLSSNLVAFRDIAGSTRVEDRFPDEGTRSGP